MQYFLDLSWGVIAIFENVKCKIAILYAWYPLWKHYIHEDDNKIISDIENRINLKLMINSHSVASPGEKGLQILWWSSDSIPSTGFHKVHPEVSRRLFRDIRGYRRWGRGARESGSESPRGKQIQLWCSAVFLLFCYILNFVKYHTPFPFNLNPLI